MIQPVHNSAGFSLICSLSKSAGQHIYAAADSEDLQYLRACSAYLRARHKATTKSWGFGKVYLF